MNIEKILAAWLLSKLDRMYEISIYPDVDTAVSWYVEIAAIAPSWFLKSDDCETFEEWIEKHPGMAKPFDFEFIPFRWFQKSGNGSAIIRYDAVRLLALLVKVELSSLDVHDFQAIESKTSYLLEMHAYLIGYEQRVLQVKGAYIDGPGAASKLAGEWKEAEVLKILNKIGGLKGYYALPHGQKKNAIEEITDKIKAKDLRNVYNLLNKLRSRPQEN